ncbi:MAG: domain S-box protein [Ferruginibacter sp.]|uniref:PAS domain-containing protein n=1 Tax=Ferruginibacter sp. TaxID=1940288 RepID=UPI00265A54CD|nr:PAS domain-containing protein [Ferruginibacter sp.]MDB5279240.1 domain S-box protein [Ferruginibacter sp.]
MTKKKAIFEKYASNNLGELAIRISDHIDAMLAYWDKDLVCRYANSAYVNWFNKSKEQMINNMRIDELLGPLYEKNLPYIHAVLLGQKQLFEREIPLPDGSGVRHSLATYIPDIDSGEVIGFFVHVADVTSLKELEKKINTAKRDTLQMIIETEETEKRQVVEILRESVNQTLAASKMEIERRRKEEGNINMYTNLSSNLSEIIGQLNHLCENLSPTEIDLLGLIESVEHYIARLSKQHQKKISFCFRGNNIENIGLKDKYAIFRILQNCITICFDSGDINNIEVSLKYTESQVIIKFVTDNKIELNKDSKEYHTIASRVDYYSGKISKTINQSQTLLIIELFITEMR